jgi:protein TonB
MLRSTSFGLGPMALGISVVVHTAVFVAAASRPKATEASGEAVTFDVVAEPPPVTPDPDATYAAPVERTVSPPARVRSNTSSPGHTTRPEPTAGVAAHAAPVDTSSDDLPRFTIALGGGAAGARGAVAPGGTGPAREAGSSLVSEDAVDVRARLVRGLPPTYPAAARADGVEGDVVLELVVGVSGGVESARVVRGVGHGLDEAAVRAADAFRFAPASKDSAPVRVRMLWPVQFRLQ